ncbi:MAG: ATP-grasp domain-containing protein [Anaerolineales bacterium]|nr:ATP-grasp domain-containing protein [Anaerolineales bacterium]
MPPIRALLIANRGEIAVRLIRACREADVRAIAVYSDADAGALHARLADRAVRLGPAAPAASYLNVERLLAAAREAGVDAVHPGYGFLSENANFAAAVRAAGLIFVGPSAEAMRLMGSKTEARARMQAAGVPVVPGFQPQLGDTPPPEAWAAAAAALGYPVLVKAAGGGGGRGMRVVASPADLAAALDSARRESAGAFGDPAVFLEKYLPRARHIEFQVFGDDHGHVIQLGERECSVQRRHQKVIEEAPSPLLEAHPGLRAAMGQAAVAAAQAVGYTNAGTVEFIVDPDTLAFYFLEMNTRLQVEHPVTEAVTGLDLVQLQLRVAAGEALPVTQADLAARGHALECRLYAEDPAHDFLPDAGPLLACAFPSAPGVRIDAGYATGDVVSPHYDALLAKLIVHAPDRAAALARAEAALAATTILGVTTNLAFLRALLLHPEFVAGTATTRLIAEHFADWQPPAPPPLAFLAAALADHLGLVGLSVAAAPAPAADRNPWALADGFRIGGR